MNGIRWLGAVSTLLAVAVVTGCATVAPMVSPEEQVTKRAQARWDFLLAGKLEAAYEYLSPAQRSAMSLMDYQRQVLSSKVRWRTATAESAECLQQVCTASIKLGIQVMAAVPGVPSYQIDQTIREKWIQADNQWWYVPE